MNTIEIEAVKTYLRESLNALERLEGVEGAERSLVTMTRSGGGQENAEQRSAEVPRVTPGEAEAAFRDLAAFWFDIAKAHRREAPLWRHAKNNHEITNQLRRVASHGWFFASPGGDPH